MPGANSVEHELPAASGWAAAELRIGFLEVSGGYHPCPHAAERGWWVRGGEDARDDRVSRLPRDGVGGTDGEAMWARGEPSGDQEAKVAAVVVAGVVVRCVVLHPAHLAVDQEVDACDFRGAQFRIGQPVHPQGQDPLSVERRGDLEWLSCSGGGSGRDDDDERDESECEKARRSR